MATSEKVSRLAIAVATASLAIATYAPSASADSVSPTGKGIVGGALLGGEVVTITEAIIGVHPGWAYLVGGIVGAGGGAVGGYFVEQSSSNAQVPVYMLAGGLALVIPALVLSLNATRYQPEEGATEDRAPTGPAADPGAVPPTTEPPPKPQARHPSRLPVSLVSIETEGLRLGVPIPDVRAMWTAAELSQYGLRQGTEMRVPMLNMTF